MRPFFTFDRLDRYALRLMAGPLGMALVALLLAQLLERLLRLFDLAASAGAPVTSVLWMAANLVPHYLGLALPMAFTAAIFMAAARLSDDSELDVMLVMGRSIARVAMPYFMFALVLSIFNVFLFAQLQPLARYGYHVAVFRVLQTGWDARVEDNRFVDVGQGYTFSADTVEPGGRQLRGVFMQRRIPGLEEVLTAQRGRFVSAADGRHLVLEMQDGLILRERSGPAAGDTPITVTRFSQGTADHDFSTGPPPFPARGKSSSERTLGELWRDMHESTDPKRVAASAADFHGRLARALILPFLPLLALPLGMASKRGRRAPGVVFATVALLVVDHALQIGESLAESGRLPAAAAVWTPFACFALLSLWIFRSSLAWPGDNPVLRAVVAIENLFERALPQRRRRKSATEASA